MYVRPSDRMEQFCSQWKDFQHSKKRYNTVRNNIKCSVQTLKIFKWCEEKLSGSQIYRNADKSLARSTSLCVLFDGENISFHASLVTYINSTNIPPIMIINTRLYEYQNLLSL